MGTITLMGPNKVYLTNFARKKTATYFWCECLDKKVYAVRGCTTKAKKQCVKGKVSKCVKKNKKLVNTYYRVNCSRVEVDGSCRGKDVCHGYRYTTRKTNPNATY